MKISYLIAIMAVVAMLLLVGCKPKEVEPEPVVVPEPEPEPEPEPVPVVPEGKTIELEKFDISVADVTVEAGATVTWEIKGDTKHRIQVKLDKEVLESSEILEDGDSYSYTFDEAGEYAWLSAPYAGIVRGTVTVE